MGRTCPEGMRTQESLRRPCHLSRLGGGAEGRETPGAGGPHGAQPLTEGVGRPPGSALSADMSLTSEAGSPGRMEPGMNGAWDSLGRLLFTPDGSLPETRVLWPHSTAQHLLRVTANGPAQETRTEPRGGRWFCHSLVGDLRQPSRSLAWSSFLLAYWGQHPHPQPQGSCGDQTRQ